MRPILMLCSAFLFSCSTCQAQLFPRLFGGKSTAQVGSSCPSGVCPTAQSSYSYPVASAVIQPLRSAAGHWSYPGSIDSHLEGTHGVATAGLTRQQKLDLHDSLHEGTAAKARYPTVSSAVGYGSSGSVASGGSAGSLAVGSRLADGSIVTSVGVTVAQVKASGVCDCCCPDCKCNQASAVSSEAKTFGAFGGPRRDFKKSLLEAAKQAESDGDISAQDYRKLSFALRIPGVAAKMEAAMTDHAIESGVAKAGQIDWGKLLSFIKEMIPVILQLIQLFAENLPQMNLDHPYVMRLTESDMDFAVSPVVGARLCDH